MTIRMDDEIFNVDEAAEFARVSPSVIRRWFDEGLYHVPTVSKVGRTGPRMEIVRKSTLLAFIEAREVGALVHPGPFPDPPKKGKPGRKPTETNGEKWRAGR
jgi:hypothetical protein